MSDGGENDEKGEPSHTVGGNASRGSHSGKHFVKQLNTQLPYDPAVALLHECPMGRLARGRKPPGADRCLCVWDRRGGQAPRGEERCSWRPDLSAIRASPSCPGSRSPRRSCPRGRPARHTCHQSRSSSLRRQGRRGLVTGSTVTSALQPIKTKTCWRQDSARDQAHGLNRPPRPPHE